MNFMEELKTCFDIDDSSMSEQEKKLIEEYIKQSIFNSVFVIGNRGQTNHKIETLLEQQIEKILSKDILFNNFDMLNKDITSSLKKNEEIKAKNFLYNYLIEYINKNGFTYTNNLHKTYEYEIINKNDNLYFSYKDIVVDKLKNFRIEI